MNDLLNIAKRLEEATGPDRELDELLMAWSVGATRQEDATFDHKPAYHRDGSWVSIHPIEPLTGSVDAALAMTERELPGWTVQLFQLRRNKGWGARVSSPRYETYSSFEDQAHATDDGYVGQKNGALAICLALVRALIAKEGR